MPKTDTSSIKKKRVQTLADRKARQPKKSGKVIVVPEVFPNKPVKKTPPKARKVAEQLIELCGSKEKAIEYLKNDYLREVANELEEQRDFQAEYQKVQNDPNHGAVARTNTKPNDAR